jgi:hypothetical protein
LTGDPQLLAEARNIARSFRNTARSSPIGFMTTQINNPGSKDVYGGQGNFEPYFGQSASQCQAHFQQALMCNGLVEYYLMSRDIEALDALIAFGDCMTHRAMLKDEQGKRLGWTYVFGDYWGPYTTEQAKKWHFDLQTTQMLGWLTHFTGRADFRDVTTDAVTTLNRDDSWITAAQMAVFHPKQDIQPPAAVTDLKAEALGDGKVRLTWTTPAGDPARYQVKWSTAKIFERIEGWPDRTLPLPQDKAQWEARAAAFNTKQVNFWAANNTPGTPHASTNSPVQTITVDKLPAGTVHIALKAWDAAGNMSEISNVIEVDVK